jgi:DNA uptake protein ComE-like DNA-binding protein
MVLWIVTVLSAMALEVGLLTRLRLQATGNCSDGIRALMLARAGVERAVAELKAHGSRAATLLELLESDQVLYHDVDLGDGSYTLLAGHDEGSGEVLFGIGDETAFINVNEADERMLGAIPGLNVDLVEGIMALREELDGIDELEDLRTIPGIDEVLLYGEDRNRNGVLDLAEDDGDATWPADDGDGILARGLAGYLTCHSAARNLTVDGDERVNINSADEQELRRSLEGISGDQAFSIVKQRESREFSNIAELLDVPLVRKQQSGNGASTGSDGDGEEGRSTSEGGRRGSDSGETDSGSGNGNGESEDSATGDKAFSAEEFREIADLVTTSDEDTLTGVINVNTAGRDVLACLPGFDGDIAAEIVDMRRESPFNSIAGLLDVFGVSADILKGVCANVSVRSDVFRVISYGVVGGYDGERVRACCAVLTVIDRTEDTARLRSWRELQ